MIGFILGSFIIICLVSIFNILIEISYLNKVKAWLNELDPMSISTEGWDSLVSMKSVTPPVFFLFWPRKAVYTRYEQFGFDVKKPLKSYGKNIRN